MTHAQPQPESPEHVAALLARIRQLEQSNGLLRKQNKKLRARVQALRAGVDVPDDEVEQPPPEPAE
jgi:hypothetical protein